MHETEDSSKQSQAVEEPGGPALLENEPEVLRTKLTHFLFQVKSSAPEFSLLSDEFKIVYNPTKWCVFYPR